MPHPNMITNRKTKQMKANKYGIEVLFYYIEQWRVNVLHTFFFGHPFISLQVFSHAFQSLLFSVLIFNFIVLNWMPIKIYFIRSVIYLEKMKNKKKMALLNSFKDNTILIAKWDQRKLTNDNVVYENFWYFNY